MATVQIEIGLMAPPLTDQLAVFGLDEKVAARLEAINKAISRLYLHGYIPAAQSQRARKKLMKEIQTEVTERSKGKAAE